MSTSVTLVPETATAPDAPRGIARGFKLARRGRPDDASVCFGLAIALPKLNGFEDSIIWTQKALALDPSKVEFHHAIGGTGTRRCHGRRRGASNARRPRVWEGVKPQACNNCHARACGLSPEAIEIAVAKAGARSRPRAANHV